MSQTNQNPVKNYTLSDFLVIKTVVKNAVETKNSVLVDTVNYSLTHTSIQNQTIVLRTLKDYDTILYFDFMNLPGAKAIAIRYISKIRDIIKIKAIAENREVKEYEDFNDLVSEYVSEFPDFLEYTEGK